MFLRLLASRDGLLEGGRGHVHRCHRHLVGHRPDRVAGPADEDPRQQAHHHGRAALRDAPAHVVRVRIPDLDDVGRRNLGVHLEVSCHLQWARKMSALIEWLSIKCGTGIKKRNEGSLKKRESPN